MIKKVDGVWIPENPEDEPAILAAIAENERDYEARMAQEPSIDELLSALSAMGVRV